MTVLIYPFIEAWVKGDHREHHIADRPRNAPTRTAIGVAGLPANTPVEIQMICTAV